MADFGASGYSVTSCAIKLDNYRPSDREFLLGIRQDAETQSLLAAEQVQQSKLEASEWVSRATRDPERYFWIIRADEKPVGFVQIFNIRSTVTPPLLGIAVDSSCRGKGFARKSIALVAKRLHRMGFERLALDVLESNDIALRWYRRLGFTLVRTETPSTNSNLLLRLEVEIKNLVTHYDRKHDQLSNEKDI